MAPRVLIIPATEAHAHVLAPRVRAADAAEVMAACGQTPLEALLDGVDRSVIAWTALFDADIACMWGVAQGASYRAGIAWLLTSDLVERYPITFMRYVRVELPRLLLSFDVLNNAIEANHTQAIRWARRLGFHMDEEPIPLGRGSFYRFAITRKEAYDV